MTAVTAMTDTYCYVWAAGTLQVEVGSIQNTAEKHFYGIKFYTYMYIKILMRT